MWKINQRNERDYTGGKNDFETVAKIAHKCPAFKPDDEDEMVADEPISCYNCLFRRWTASSFSCCNHSH